MTRKAIFITEETHAQFRVLQAKEIVKNQGRKVSSDDLLKKLMDEHKKK